MASRRAFVRLSLRSAPSAAARCASPLQRAALAQPSISQRVLAQPTIRPLANQIRCFSAENDRQSKIYDFNGIQQIVSSPSSKTLLIDVREPHEYEAGFIPSAINIPVASQPDALFLSPDEFEDRFGFAKPPPGKEVVFYCKAGVRSQAAAQLALNSGYERVGEYKGSWLDWVKNGGENAK